MISVEGVTRFTEGEIMSVNRNDTAQRAYTVPRVNERRQNISSQSAIHKHTGQSSPEHSWFSSRTAKIHPHNNAEHNIIVVSIAVTRFMTGIISRQKNNPLRFREGDL